MACWALRHTGNNIGIILDIHRRKLSSRAVYLGSVRVFMREDPDTHAWERNPSAKLVIIIVPRSLSLSLSSSGGFTPCQSGDDDYFMNETRRKPTTGAQCPTPLWSWTTGMFRGRIGLLGFNASATARVISRR